MHVMAVLERAELEASPLADLHAIADQLGLDGFRRLRKADLIDAILTQSGDGDEAAAGGSAAGEAEREAAAGAEAGAGGGSGLGRPRRRGGRARRLRRGRPEEEPGTPAVEQPVTEEAEGPAAVEQPVSEEVEGPAAVEPRGERPVAEGIVEVLDNGSAFLRVSPPEPSDEDIYISAAQVRRCELVSGDRVSGPVRAPRRSERYPSLTRIDTINGAPADSVSDGARFDELPVVYPSERLSFGAADPTLEAIEWLTPLGRGSRVAIVGEARSGKTETLRKLAAALAEREDLELMLVLAGARPEEVAFAHEGIPAPFAALSFASSADAQGQAVERAIDAGRRVAARGGDAVVLIDGLDGLHPAAARKALAAARNLRDAGSLTVIVTAGRPFGGETTVIALDASLTATGRQPILDLAASGTLRPELLVGEDGAQAITKARARALEAG
jgi:transcription termination factor Rho